jgi:hypothetical protein
MVTFKNQFFLVKSQQVSAMKIQSAKEADKIKRSFLLRRQQKFDKINSHNFGLLRSKGRLKKLLNPFCFA